MDNQSERRLVENELLFRSTNREVQRRVKQDRLGSSLLDDTKLHFYCECSGINCRERIILTIDEYEAATDNEKQFVVLPGHENTSVEKVVRRTKHFFVVEKEYDPVRAIDPHGK